MSSSFHRSWFFSMLPAQFPIFNTPSLHLDSFPISLAQFNPTPLTPFHFISLPLPTLQKSSHHKSLPLKSSPSPPIHESKLVKSPRGSKKDHIVIDPRPIAFVPIDQLPTSTLHPPETMGNPPPFQPRIPHSPPRACPCVIAQFYRLTHSLTLALTYIHTYNLHTRQIGRRSHHRNTSPAPPTPRAPIAPRAHGRQHGFGGVGRGGADTGLIATLRFDAMAVAWVVGWVGCWRWLCFRR